MTDHLSSATLNGLADGELSAEELAATGQHLAGCPRCVSQALQQSLLKLATAQAGHRFVPPPHMHERLVGLASDTRSETGGEAMLGRNQSLSRMAMQFRPLIWAAAAALFLVVSIPMIRNVALSVDVASGERAALSNEVFDQHIATLASSLPPQVISSDRHTVKPWFQGKISFSFDLPVNLPADVVLNGANLTYLHDQPAAQLLYSIGKHHLSVFLLKRSGPSRAVPAVTEHSGFHVMVFHMEGLEGIAVSDVDPGRLASLIHMLEQSQAGAHPQSTWNPGLVQ
jgi:anti-sigma factor RsiW